MQKEGLKELKGKLFNLLNKEALRRGEFTLSSGKKSSYYLDGRVITLTPEGAYLTACIILELCREKEIEAIGGPTLGADPIVGAIAAISHIKNIPIKTFIVRKAAKEHGTQRQIEGPQLKAGSKAVLVDDVATTGKALIEAKQALDKAGIICDTAFVIVDRCEGAAENLKGHGLNLESVFSIKEFGL
jgi:orotate phosphoribosyltransferase